jgi:uncharacterized protein with HEPN domain
MRARSPVPRLSDMMEAIERIKATTVDMSLEDFEADWRSRWLVERGIEIISEASRHLSDPLKSRHPASRGGRLLRSVTFCGMNMNGSHRISYGS